MVGDKKRGCPHVKNVREKRILDETLDVTLLVSHAKRPGRKIAVAAEHESPPGSEGST
jgi:hypothetical protein